MGINNIGKTFVKVWNANSKYLAPAQPPLLSFINHPEFQVVKECSGFAFWHQFGFGTFLPLCKQDDLLSYESLQIKIV